MKLSVTLLVVVAIAAISTGCKEPPPPVLESGRWLGTLLPIGHPENKIEVYYRVSYSADGLAIIVGATGKESRDARDIHLTADTLKFVFDEPEADVPLHCAFGLQANGGYEGLCADAEGKSAYFTMRPPDPSGGDEA